MNRRYVALVIVVIFMMFLMSACDAPRESAKAFGMPNESSSPADTKDADNIDPALALKLRKDYRQFLIDKYGRIEEWSLEKIWVSKYFGNYSGCEVVYMASPLAVTTALRPVEIAGYTIVFRDGAEVYAYKDSKFYTLKEAYDAGYITKADVYEIGKQVGIGFTEEYPNP